MKSATERRKYPRSKPEPGVSITVTPADFSGGAAGPNLAAKLIDVSAIGACIVSTAPLREGAPLSVELTLTGAKAGRYPARATVRWSQFLESEGQETHVAGLEFETPIEPLVGKVGESALLDIFLTLRVSVAQLRLYPKDSPQVLKVLTDTYHSIHSFLESAGTLTVSKTARGLLINGRPLPAAGPVADSLETAMLSLLTDSQIKSITFKKGLTLEELLTFLHALTKKFWDVKDGKEINRRLREERVLQVSVDEVTYVALGEGDLVIEDAARKLEGGDAEVARLMQNLDQLVESATQGMLGAEGRLLIMKRLIEQDPNLLKKAHAEGILGPGPGGGAGAGGAGAATGAGGEGTGGAGAVEGREVGRVTFDEARDALGDLAALLSELPEPSRGVLRRIGRTFVEAFRHVPSLRAVMEALLQGAAARTIPGIAQQASAQQPHEPAAVTRAAQLLAMSDDERVQALSQEGSALLEELAALDRPDLVRALLDSLCGCLSDRAARRRLAAARTLGSLRRVFERDASEDTVESVELVIRSGLDQERDAGVYPALADLAGFLADLQIRRGVHDRALQIVDLLHRHYKIKDPAFVQRGELAYIALERLAAGAGFASLAGKVRSGDPEATHITEALGSAATRFLIGQIKAAESASSRLQLAGMIARAGPGAATVLLDEIRKTLVPSDVLRLLEVLPQAMTPDMAEMALSGVLRHPTLAVRKKAAALFAEQAYPRAGAALLDAFRAEQDGPTRIVIAECLGRIRAKGSVEELASVAESRTHSDDLRAAACQALGQIGDPRAVPVLTRVCLKGEKGLTSILRAVPASVRAAAARALALFPAHKEARESLRKAGEDKDPLVRSAARQARYGPLLEAFGDRVQGAALAATPAEVGAEVGKVGGTLVEVPLEILCRRLAQTEASGLLSFNLQGMIAQVWLHAGVVVAVDAEGRRDLDAFSLVAGRREGYFLFQPGEEPPERRMLQPMETLLLEAVRIRSAAPRPGSDTGLRPAP
jgi:hypothetical protein